MIHGSITHPQPSFPSFTLFFNSSLLHLCFKPQSPQAYCSNQQIFLSLSQSLPPDLTADNFRLYNTIFLTRVTYLGCSLKNAKSEFPHFSREDNFIFHLPWLKPEFSLLIFSQLMKVFFSCACTLCHLNQSAVIQDCQTTAHLYHVFVVYWLDSKTYHIIMSEQIKQFCGMPWLP